MKRATEQEVKPTKNKVGRPKSPPSTQVSAPLNMHAIDKASAALTALGKLHAEAEQRATDLALKVGYEGPIEADAIQIAATSIFKRAAVDMLDGGRMLLVLKELVGHGRFLERLANMSLAPRMAQRLMQAALKFSQSPATRRLAEKVGSRGAMLELLVLDDQEIKALAEEGSIGEIVVDEIDSMGLQQLRAKVRDLKQKQESLERLDARRETRFREIEEKLEQPYKPGADHLAKTKEQESELLALSNALVSAETGWRELAKVANDLMLKYEGKETLDLRARQCFDYIVRQVFNQAMIHNITIEPTDAAKVDPYTEAGMASWNKATGAAGGRK